MNIDLQIRERHLWQIQTPGLLTVAVAGPPLQVNTVGVTLALAEALAVQEKWQRPDVRVLVAELDFWSPALVSRAHVGEDGVSRRDFLDVFLEIAGDASLQEHLRTSQGIPRNEGDLRLWRERTATQWPELVSREGEKLALFPARVGQEACDRALRTSPHDLVSVRAKPFFLPGVAVWRALLAVAARRHNAGIVVLSLPSGWNPLTMLVSSSIADVVVLLSAGDEAELPHWNPVIDYLTSRRRSSTSRPESEEEIHLLLRPTKRGKPLAELEDFRNSVAIQVRSQRTPNVNDLKAVARELDFRAAYKATGLATRETDEPEAADRELLSELTRWRGDQASLRILVEEGAYGELPILSLSKKSQEKLSVLTGSEADLKGFRLEPMPISHADLFNMIKDSTDLGRRIETDGIDLLTFPHYMLGKLVESDLLLPWHVLEVEVEKSSSPPILSELAIDQSFHRVDEMCRYNGVLYAVPYSLLQKVVLLKRGTELVDVPPYWRELREALESKAGDADGEEPRSWPLLLETDPGHIGVWYDWLEFVNAYGGADFRPEAGKEKSFRGSDYGECWLNHPRTVEATSEYLGLLQRTQERFPQPIDWDRLLDTFLSHNDVSLTVAWSDIVGFHWRKRDAVGGSPNQSPEPIGLKDIVTMYPFPLGRGDGRTSVEGWVMAVPRRIEGDRRRLAARAVSWFLSPQVQRRYAEVGGNTARRNLGHVLGEVQRLVHRALFFPQVPPALKMTFREAPAVIEVVSEALQSWLQVLLETGEPPADHDLGRYLDKLARKVASTLRNKVRYRPPAYWNRPGGVT